MTIFHRGQPGAARPNPNLSDVTEKLVADHGAHIDLATISRAVLDCLHDLQGSPAAACAVGLEHLARSRLLELIETDASARDNSRHTG